MTKAPLVLVFLSSCTLLLSDGGDNQDTDAGASGAVVVLLPDSVELGAVVIGLESAPFEFQVVALEPVDRLASTITPSMEFFLASDDCSGASMIEGQVCKVGVVFKPATADDAVGDFEIGGASASLTARGLAPGDLSVEPTLLDFGSVPSGTSVPITITVSYEGDEDLSNVSIAGTVEFTVTNEQCSQADLNSSNPTCDAEVTFRPNMVGSLAASLAITGSAPSGPVETALSVSGVATPEAFSVSINHNGGEGAATSSPGSINCRAFAGPCMESFPALSTVTLTASGLMSWGGACAGTANTAPCVLLMDRNHMVLANFNDSN